MNTKINPLNSPNSRQAGNALLMVMIMSGVALAVLAAAMAWSSNSARLTHRVIQRDRSTAAAEAATEKVVSLITRDYMYGGENLVLNNLNSYRSTLPTTADSPYWSQWQFDNGAGNVGQTYVERTTASSYVTLDPIYAGLKGFVSTYTVVSHAKDQASIQDVNAGVLQQIQLAAIPIFQFAMYSYGDMEISCGQAFDVTGRVHSNNNLYVEPDALLTFESGVTAVVSNIFGREPLDTRGPPSGGVDYVHPELKLSPVQALTLPIGTTNSPEAIREIIEPPPVGESASTPTGRLRYYNLCDMIITATNGGLTAQAGLFHGFVPFLPECELTNFVSLGAGFWDAREGKTVLPIDINIGALTAWNLTNTSLRPLIPGGDLTAVYVVDARSLPANQLGAVRVYNGLVLPPKGLTVATGRPLYVWGDYNEFDPTFLGTTNTSATRPASLVADAISILSDGWIDARSTSSKPPAQPTTINAAFLTGVVETTAGSYSGGMENFPRFLEDWGAANTFTYNGSMVKMFPSLYATGPWTGSVYNPPKRNWAFDAKFDSSTGLPPKTPALQQVVRKQWATVIPGQNTVPALP